MRRSVIDRIGQKRAKYAYELSVFVEQIETSDTVVMQRVAEQKKALLPVMQKESEQKKDLLPIVLVHLDEGGDLRYAAPVVMALRSHGFNAPDAASYPKSMDHHEIHYYWEGDQATASHIAGILKAQGIDAEQVYLPKTSPRPRTGHFEVYLDFAKLRTE